MSSRRRPTPSQVRRAIRLDQAAETSPAAARELDRMVDAYIEGELEPEAPDVEREGYDDASCDD
jgi:hypothetical protein